MKQDMNENKFISLPQESQKTIETSVYNILQAMGEQPNREGLVDTPKRVTKAYDFLTSGYRQDLDTIVNNAIFDDANENGMVIVQDIEIYSMCEHHILPFYGKAHVAYLPKEKVIGISKIPRIVDMFSRRLQIQERLTGEIAKALQQVLQPRGVAVVIEAKHMCMMMRGVEKQNSFLSTSYMIGEFLTSQPTRMEFLSLINRTGK